MAPAAAGPIVDAGLGKPRLRNAVARLNALERRAITVATGLDEAGRNDSCLYGLVALIPERRARS